MVNAGVSVRTQAHETRQTGSEEKKKKVTHQLEILNATNEVGSVGPTTFNVHTICK